MVRRDRFVQPTADDRPDRLVERDQWAGVLEPFDVARGARAASRRGSGRGRPGRARPREGGSDARAAESVEALAASAFPYDGSLGVHRDVGHELGDRRPFAARSGTVRAGRPAVCPRRSSRRHRPRRPGCRYSRPTGRRTASRSAAGRAPRRAWRRRCWRGRAHDVEQARDAPTATGPPQSCAASTSGPSTSLAAESHELSRTRSARRRGPGALATTPFRSGRRPVPASPGRARFEHVAPDVTPGGIAVHADDRARGDRAGVEDVPVDRRSRSPR